MTFAELARQEGRFRAGLIHLAARLEPRPDPDDDAWGLSYRLREMAGWARLQVTVDIVTTLPVAALAVALGA